MLASVTRLRSRVGSLDKALSLFREAHFRRCITELGNLQSPSASFIRARAALRLGQPTEALRAIEVIDVDCGDQRARGELALLRAVILKRLGDDEGADSSLRDAAVFGISSDDPALNTEVEVFRGLFAFGRGDISQAKAAFERGLEVCATSWNRSLSEGIVPREHIVARIQELLGVVHAGDGQYAKQLDFVRASLATLDSYCIKDVYQEAFALRNLSILARDFDIDDYGVFLTSRVADLSYTQDIAAVQFTTLEALSWCYALRGDVLSALRKLRQCESLAQNEHEKVMLAVNRALLARDASHHSMVEEEIEFALSVSQAYDWNVASGDSREALLALAQSASAISPSRARKELDRYVSITRSMDITYAARIEPRARAEEDYTHGVVLRSEGRLGASMERLESAFKTWDSIGYAWRAGRAALELAELDAGEVFRLAVRRELNRRPESPFAKRARLVA